MTCFDLDAFVCFIKLSFGVDVTPVLFVAELLQPSSAVMFSQEVDKLLTGRFECLPVVVLPEYRPELCKMVSFVLIALTRRLD